MAALVWKKFNKPTKAITFEEHRRRQFARAKEMSLAQIYTIPYDADLGDEPLAEPIYSNPAAISPSSQRYQFAMWMGLSPITVWLMKDKQFATLLERRGDTAYLARYAGSPIPATCSSYDFWEYVSAFRHARDTRIIFIDDLERMRFMNSLIELLATPDIRKCIVKDKSFDAVLYAIANSTKTSLAHQLNNRGKHRGKYSSLVSTLQSWWGGSRFWLQMYLELRLEFTQ
jgi:hypothetical protein